MKTARFFFSLSLVAVAVGWGSPVASAQTPGSATFSVGTTAYSAKYDPRNVAVVWVENSSGQFVKTLCRHAGSRINYLYQWSSARGSYTDVDGVTSATINSQPQTHTVVWDCRDTNNAVVADGLYFFKAEYTSINGQGPNMSTGVSFMKGTASVSTTFPNVSSTGGEFTGLSIDFTPTLPDVAVTGMSPTAGSVNSNVAVVVTISNQTDAATASFTVALSNVTSGATLIGSQVVSSLGAAAVTNLTFSWSTAGLIVGDYDLEAHAIDLASETDLADNTGNLTVALSGSVRDVVAHSFTLDSVIPPGVLTNVVVTVQNAGEQTESFGVTLREITDAQTIGTAFVSSLASGASSNVIFVWDTTGVAIGTHTLQAVADTVVDEVQTTNNTNTLAVIVANGLETNSLIARGAEWRYLDDGLDISGAPWTLDPANYYDGFWSSGAAPLGYGVDVIVTTLSNDSGEAPPSSEAEDDAADAVYDDGWATGDNGGSGFGDWAIDASGTGGQFMGSSAGNAGGASGDIDTGGRAWGLWASSGTTEAVRPLSGGALSIGQVVQLSFDNGWVSSSQSVGVALRNAASNSLWEFLFLGGTNNYYVKDGSGTVYTAIPFTGDGLQIAFEQTGATAYSTDVSVGTNTWNFTGTLITQADMEIAQLRGWNFEAGSGGNYDVFLNNLSVSSTVVVTNDITTWFRKEFTLDFEPITVSGLARIVDGAILYLNGQEIDRVNMPTGSVNGATPATVPVIGSDTTNYTSFAIAPDDLAIGRNWLAAEVHLSSSANTAKAFDLELTSFNSVVARTQTVIATGLQPVGDIQSGDEAGAVVTLNHTGNAATECTVLIRDTATGEILATLAVPLLVAGESTDVHLPWPTLGLDTGTRVLEAATVIDGTTNWIATTTQSIVVAAQDFTPHLVGASGSIGGYCGAVAASGARVYLGSGATLDIWDATVPAAPVRMGSIRLSGVIESLVLQGDVVYAAAGNSGVHIVDVSNPAAPVHSATFDTSGNAHRLVIVGSTLFIADGRGGVRGLDITTPASPTLISAAPTAGAARSVIEANPNMVVLDMDDGIQILTTASAPALVGENQEVTAGVDLAGVTDAVLVSDANGGLFRVDISTPAMPVITTNVLLPSAGRSLLTSGSALYIAAGSGGLLTVDPATLAVLDTDATAGEASDLALSGSTLAVAVGFGGCQIWDLSSPLAPVWIATFGAGARAVDAGMSANTLFVAGDESGLQVHDLTDPAAPEWVTTVPSSTNPRCLTVSDSLVYVAEALGGLKIYSITNPTAPAFVGSDSASGLVTVRRLALSGSHLAMTDGHQVNLLDVSNPAAPLQIASNIPSGYVFDLTASDTHFYAACGGSGLRILDRSTLGTVGTYSTEPSPVVSVTVQGDQAYIGDGSGTFRTLDISTPASPAFVQSTAAPGFGMASAGSLLYLVGGDNEGAVMDVSAPLTPVSALSLPHLTYGLRVRAQGGVVLTAEDEAGLGIFNVSPADINLNGIADTVDQQIVDDNPTDSIQTVWDVLGADDYDGDGLANLAETLAGTSPVDSGSFFAVSVAGSLPGVGSGEFVVRWFSEPGKTYTIHKATNLVSGFTPLLSGIANTTPLNSYTDTVDIAVSYYMISTP